MNGSTTAGSPNAHSCLPEGATAAPIAVSSRTGDGIAALADLLEMKSLTGGALASGGRH